MIHSEAASCVGDDRHEPPPTTGSAGAPWKVIPQTEEKVATKEVPDFDARMAAFMAMDDMDESMAAARAFLSLEEARMRDVAGLCDK